MRIILLGSPGAGKGTQAIYLSRHFNIPIISTGDMIRNAIKDDQSELGKHTRSVMASGGLISDAQIVELVKNRITRNDCRAGYLFDGFPRTIFQASAIHTAGLAIDYVIEICVPSEEILHRLSGRLIHLSSGRVYHPVYNPPKNPNQDDLTGEPLVQRPDDTETVINHRLQIYQEKTKPLVQFYQELATQSAAGMVIPKYITIDGLGEIDQVSRRILQAIEQCKVRE